MLTTRLERVMTYHIIRGTSLGGSYRELEPGYKMLVRVSCPEGLRPEQATLEQIVPLHASIVPNLIAYHDGGGEGDAFYDRFAASIIVSVEARHGEKSHAMIEKYLKLLERLLEALPDTYEDIRSVIEATESWGKELDPRRKAPVIGAAALRIG